MRFSGQTQTFISNCSTSMGERRLTLLGYVSNCLGPKAAIPTPVIYTLLSFPTGTPSLRKKPFSHVLRAQQNKSK